MSHFHMNIVEWINEADVIKPLKRISVSRGSSVIDKMPLSRAEMKSVPILLIGPNVIIFITINVIIINHNLYIAIFTKSRPTARALTE